MLAATQRLQADGQISEEAVQASSASGLQRRSFGQTGHCDVQQDRQGPEVSEGQEGHEGAAEVEEPGEEAKTCISSKFTRLLSHECHSWLQGT